ncbi:elicitor protein [Microsporum canis CBS 113480]|uniref:Elicitor protein n=1 Tax=Arthroderma otae (strain ATCC MYA-4605 / CBS 113480) TaxID=554155 RepID=C5FDF0_ARTOC|nr:elicitor protein [Microsporum canis CBS 113480]EEQ27924.1 elicitor protein [Microsporum canis CBS 113480]
MADVRSKNPYELLGNDPELDPNREPEPPVKVVDKNPPRRGKRDGPNEPRDTAPPRTNNRGPRLPTNEQAFRDRNAGSQNNRNRPTDGPSDRAQPAAHKNRDARGNMIREDRHSRTDRVVTDKQVEQGWGSRSGESNLKDERAGEDIAQSDEKEADEANAEEPEEEPEDKSKSYADYLAEQAESKLELSAKESRKANEGTKADKKWANAKELKRDDDEEAYIKGQSKETKRERQRKEKNVLEVDMRFVEAPRRGGDSFRGRGRGGRGGRGEFRGGRGNSRGAPRGGPPHASGPTVDEKNFPSLGGK